MSISINTKGIKTTAASRLVFEDLKVGEIFEELSKATEVFGEAAEHLRAAKEEHQDAVSSQTDITNEVARRVTDEYYASTTKQTQAELERRIKQAIAESDPHVLASNKVYNLKLDLDDKQAAFDFAKVNHRTLTTQANLVGQTLGFLSASKTARTAHLAALSEV